MLDRVTFEHGKRSYDLAFTTSAMIAYEQKYDQSFMGFVKSLEGADTSTLKVSVVADLFTCALRGGLCELDDEEVSRLIDELPFTTLVGLVGEAISAAFPQDAKTGKKATRAQSKKSQPLR